MPMDRIKQSLVFRIIALSIVALLLYEVAQQITVLIYALS